MKLQTTAGAMLVATTLLLAATSASALCNISIQAPTSTVTPDGSGNYAYDYTLSGVGGSCVFFHGSDNYVTNTFEMPYFADAGITAIESPAGWTYAIVATDTFSLGSGAETLVWTADTGYGLQPDTGTGTVPTQSGFGYAAGYGSAYSEAGVLLGTSPYPDFVDPALPGSPDALAAGLQLKAFPSASAVPEPSAALALLAGLGLLGFVRRRRA